MSEEHSVCEVEGCGETAVLFPLGRDRRLHEVCAEHEREGAERGDWRGFDESSSSDV